MARASGGGQSGGFVLVVVLWSLAIISLLTLTVSMTMRFEARAVANLAIHAEYKLLADGLTRVVSADVATTKILRLRNNYIRSGTPLACTLDGLHAVVTVTDVAGLVDLNAAPVDLLTTVIKAVSVDEVRASHLAEAIKDFRDADSDVSPRGAERTDYERAGIGHGPQNAPFNFIRELDLVLGMTPKIVERLQTLVTVHSRRPTFSKDLAPAGLLEALENDRPSDSSRRSNRVVASGLKRVRLLSKVFSVRVAVSGDAKIIATRVANVMIQPRASRPFRILEWYESAATSTERRLLQMGAQSDAHDCLAA
jgi:general secretion pathway protein K